MKDTIAIANGSLPTQGGLEGLNSSLPTQGGLNGLFFELLQIAIGNRKELTRPLTDEEWASMYGICEKQALLGIAFAGVERLPKEQYPPFDVLAEWVHDAQVTKERNEKMNAECETLAGQLENDGLWSCILKGQSNLVNYPEHLREGRTAGDIDVWCAPISKQDKGERKVIEYALSRARIANQPVPEVRYHHVELERVYPVDVEIHHRPSFMCSPLRNIRLRNWCRKFEGINETASFNGHEFPVPAVSFNAVYQLVHIYRHLFDEGIGLRQILDYYFVLKTFSQEPPLVPLRRGKMRPPESPCVGGEVSDDSFGERAGMQSSPPMQGNLEGQISSFGMKKFAGAIMYVLQKVFAMPDQYLICKPDEKEGKFLLNEIIQAGNFGKYDERIKRVEGSYMKVQCNHAFEKWKHNLRLITHYPEEVIWEPIFRIYHFVWRRCELWKV